MTKNVYYLWQDRKPTKPKYTKEEELSLAKRIEKIKTSIKRINELMEQANDDQ